VLDEQHVLGGLLYRPGDPLTVLGSEHEGAQDQDIEGALEKGDAVGVVPGRHLT
jgi:hypothetical protein